MSGLVTLLLMLLAVPQRANAYVDPGSGAMLWQIAAAAVIGTLFYVRRVTFWLRDRLGLRTPRAMGFLFATVYALLVSPLVCAVFQSHPVPRFSDIFLIGIVLTTYLFTWEAGVYLLAIGTLVSAWVLPPYGTLAVSSLDDWYRLLSFVGVSLFLLALVHRLKRRAEASETRREEPAGVMTGMAVGD